MVRTQSTGLVAASTQSVWQTLADFSTVAHWHPMVEASRQLEPGDAFGIGAVREVTIAGASPMVEKVLTAIPEQRLAYALVDPPLPIAGYVADVVLERDLPSGLTRVTWSASFEFVGPHVPEIAALAQEILDACIAGLQSKFNGT